MSEQAQERIRCSCGWSAPATVETQVALAKEHIRDSHRLPTCDGCGECLEYCCCVKEEAQ